MDLDQRLAISYYKPIAAINEPHHVYLVQHQETKKIAIKKVLDVYNLAVYAELYRNPVAGTPRIINYYEEAGQLTVIEEYISGTRSATQIYRRTRCFNICLTCAQSSNSYISIIRLSSTGM